MGEGQVRALAACGFLAPLNQDFQGKGPGQSLSQDQTPRTMVNGKGQVGKITHSRRHAKRGGGSIIKVNTEVMKWCGGMVILMDVVRHPLRCA